ncbi:MAG: hypothetical protein ACT4NY_27580 [Pseudonocardiales bacterium]
MCGGPRDPIDELGRAIHDRYVQSAPAKGDKPATNASLVPWAKLPAHLKRSNWAHADHIDAKLATIDSVIVPAREGAEPFSFRPGEVEALARLEHERWMAERRAAGFVYGPERNGHLHPDLVDWEHLSPEARAKDIDFIQHLPELLHQSQLSNHALTTPAQPTRRRSARVTWSDNDHRQVGVEYREVLRIRCDDVVITLPGTQRYRRVHHV